jgi:hypothetical protein
MQTENFNLEKLHQIYQEEINNALENKLDMKQLEYDRSKEYISSYFYPTIMGDHYLWSDNNFICYDKTLINNTYVIKFPGKLGEWYFKKNLKLYNIINDISKPRIQNKEINLCCGLKHEIKSYYTFSKKIQQKVNMMLDFIRTVICSKKEEEYTYIIQWLSNMCKGKKNDSVLYFKGIEGLGKSTLTDFLRVYVLGEQIAMKSNSEPLRTSFNKILSGMLLVVFEEMPVFSEKEWEGVSSRLKDLVTSDTTMYQEKHEKTFRSKNINNYIINSNVNALQHSEGRRYFIADLSTVKLGDYDYFKELRANCFNDEVGHAFLSYLLEIKLPDDWNSQSYMPETIGKKDAIAERLPIEYKFIKFEYVLKNKSMNLPLKELYLHYQDYCYVNDCKSCTFYKFIAKLRDVSINYKKSHGINKFMIQNEELRKIANNLKWIHELDDEPTTESENEEKHEAILSTNPDVLLKRLEEKDNEIEALKKEIEELKRVKKITTKDKHLEVLKENEEIMEKYEKLNKESYVYLGDRNIMRKTKAPKKSPFSEIVDKSDLALIIDLF